MLLWKEWHERRLLLLVCLLWMVGGTAYDVASEWLHGGRGGPVTSISTTYFFGLFMPIFIAMRTSLGETTERTGSFTSALPISGQRQGWIRLGGGLAVLMAPILLGAMLISLCLALGWMELPRRPLPDRGSVSALYAVAPLWRGTAVQLSSAASLYVLLSLLATALRTEAHAGFVGAAVAILWFLGMNLVGLLHRSTPPEVAAWVDAVLPRAMHISCFDGSERGLYEELRISSRMLGPLLLHAILQFAMAAWFVRRYSRTLPGRAVETVRKAPSLLWRPWSFALPNRSIALAWLTLRQSLPMCLPGLLIACLMTPLLVIRGFTPAAIHQFRQRGELLQQFADSLPMSMLGIGLLWSVVVGAGVFSAEVDWRVGEFWRTRPIPFWRFFAAKFCVGLLAVLLVLDATTIAVSWSFPNWNWERYKSLNWPYLACIVPLHSVMFAVAVAWTCVLRRAVLGGMAALVSFALVEQIIHWSEAAARCLDPIVVYEGLGRGGIGFMANDNYLVVTAGMGVILVASIMVAGLALRRYDPRRQSG
jgi:hypothetical protein